MLASGSEGPPKQQLWFDVSFLPVSVQKELIGPWLGREVEALSPPPWANGLHLLKTRQPDDVEAILTGCFAEKMGHPKMTEKLLEKGVFIGGFGIQMLPPDAVFCVPRSSGASLVLPEGAPDQQAGRTDERIVSLLVRVYV